VWRDVFVHQHSQTMSNADLLKTLYPVVHQKGVLHVDSISLDVSVNRTDKIIRIMFIVTVSLIYCWLGYVLQPNEQIAIFSALSSIHTVPAKCKYTERQRKHQSMPNDV